MKNPKPKCSICNKVIYNRQKNAKYCLECSKEDIRQQRVLIQRRYRERKKNANKEIRI